MNNGNILHVVPESALDPDELFLGSTKDIAGRSEYFRERQTRVTRLVTKRADVLLLRRLKELNLESYSAVFLELMFYPRSLRFLRERHPYLRLLARPINPELYHRLHAILAILMAHRRCPTKTELMLAYNRMKSDYLSGRSSSYVLPISSWDADHYWRYLVGRRKVACLPYFLPEKYIRLIPRIPEKKNTQCVCLMATGKKMMPFLLDAANNFISLVGRLGDDYPEWRFIFTSELPDNARPFCRRVSSAGLLVNPLELLSESRAMALLSDYGFGFKTKILDAICSQCYVLLTESLFRRTPAELHPYCIVVKKNCVRSFKEALDRCSEQFPEGNPNDLLRDRAFKTLDKVLYAF